MHGDARTPGVLGVLGACAGEEREVARKNVGESVCGLGGRLCEVVRV